MSSIQAYKAYKQEGTLVSKVHKQGALGTSSQVSGGTSCMYQPSSFFNFLLACFYYLKENFHNHDILQ